MQLPPDVVDSAQFQVGSVARLTQVLEVAATLGTFSSGAEGAAVGGPAAIEWIHALLDPASVTWPGLAGDVIFDLEVEGLRIHQAEAHHQRGALIAWLEFGTFTCGLHHYPFEVTVDVASDVLGRAWFIGKGGVFRLAAPRLARLLVDAAGERSG